MESETPRYATLQYDTRESLCVSWAELVFLDMVQKLSIRQPWCTKSLSSCGKDLGVTKRGVMKMRDRLIEKGLLKKNVKGHLRVTEKYINVAVNKVHHPQNKSVNKVPQSVNKVHSSGEQSSTKNNNRITKNNGEGYKKFLVARESLTKKVSRT